MSWFSPSAGGHRSQAAVRRKLQRLDEPHVRPLNDLVREINAVRGDPSAAPWFDPADAGVRARVLCLLEAPGPRSTASRGSGIISADNDDLTARATYTLREQAGLPRDIVVNWNVVPWYLPDGARTKATDRRDVDEAAPWLQRLIDLLPDLRVVVTMGDLARDGWLRHLATHPGTPLLPTLAVPHPSPRRLNTDPDARDLILAALRRAVRVAAA